MHKLYLHSSYFTVQFMFLVIKTQESKVKEVKVVVIEICFTTTTTEKKMELGVVVSGMTLCKIMFYYQP